MTMNQTGLGPEADLQARTFPVQWVRSQFPALTREQRGRKVVYFDAPGGTQVCRSAIDRMRAYLEAGVANSGALFETSAVTDEIVAAARSAGADLLGGNTEEIAFGPNMTSLTLAISRALSRKWEQGDELIVTRLDHDANVAPWLAVAEDRGMVVRWWDFDPADGSLDLEQLQELLGSRTRLVALTAASNALGSLGPVQEAAAIIRQHSDALVFVDGVQSVPHVPTDVVSLGCDFLVCSAYKFFGPHVGLLWARDGSLSDVCAYKVRPASDAGPRRFETGALSFEGLAGFAGAVEHLSSIAAATGALSMDRRCRIVAAMTDGHAYEAEIGRRLLSGLQSIPNLHLFGPSTANARVPVYSFVLQDQDPRLVARRLGDAGINIWAGNFYAVEALRSLGFREGDALVRIGLCHYSTGEEIDRLIAELSQIASFSTHLGP